MSSTPAEGVRLQKVLASAGVASRRAAEELIAAGRVTVNGSPVQLGARVDPSRDIVRVDGERVAANPAATYLAVNKPVGMLSAMRTERGQPCVGDVVAGRAGGGLHHVGRLDVDTEGLLLVTTDGELSHRLTHPRYEVPKTYLVEVDGTIGRSVGRRLRAGVDLEDGPAAVDAFRLVDSAPDRSLVEVVLHEGRNRIVRRMFDAVDHPVRRLVRTAVGPVQLGELRPGRVRHLQPPEVAALYRVVDL
jgi:23S rRNA pseudouridine2605 synthase